MAALPAPARAALPAAAIAASSAFAHRASPHRGLHSSTAVLHGRRDKFELRKFKVSSPSSVASGGGVGERTVQVGKGGALGWSVRSGDAKPSRTQRRASQAEQFYAKQEARRAAQEAAAARAEAAGLPPSMPQEESWEEQQPYGDGSRGRRSRRPPARVPQQPSAGDLSHPSSEFFQPLVRQPDWRTAATADAAATAAAATTPTSPASPPQTFKDLGLASQVHTKLAGSFDIFTPTPIQSHAIPFLMAVPHFTERDTSASNPTDNHPRAIERRQRLRRTPLPRDLIIQDMTGAGKTLTYVLPLLSMIDNFKKRSVQGIIVAPTRELAVQIFRILRRLNDLRNAGKKRKLNPVTLRLAVGRVTDSYAAQVRENPGHIIVATPATLDALVNGVRVMRGHNGPREKAPLLLRPSINLRHVRMLVLDEVDHLCLPATWPRVERVLHNLNTTPSHGSMHRLGRIVLVSAALSQRVHRLTSPILHRPVTATAEGLLDGWVEERRMLRDRYRLPPNELEKLIENQQQQQQQRGGQGLERVGEEDEDVDIEQDEYADVEEEEEDDFDAVANADTMDGIGPSSMTPAERAAALEARLAARGINLSDLDPETRLAYEEADLFGDEDEEAEAERLAGEDARMQERERRKAAGEAKTDEEGGEEAQLGPLVRADDFLLPGSDAARVQALRAAAESGEEAQVNLEEEKLMPLLADYDAPPLAATSAEAEAAEAEAGEAAAAQSDASLPSATAAAVRYLPASMKHIAVHVAPSVKPMLSPYSTPEDRALVLRSWAKLLARMHAVLRPRVALVFFKRAQDALDLQAVLHTTRQLRSEVLLGGGGLRAPDRLRALESVLHGSVDFLLCTDLAARGLDMRGLTHVINFDVPATALDYVHRAGRVERLGGRKGCTVVNVVRDPREEGWSLKDTQRLIDLAQTIEQNKSVLLPQSSPADSSDANTSSIEAGVIDGSLLPSSSFPLPKRQGTFIGKSVEHMAKLQGQLHLDVRHVVLEGGQMHDLVTPPHVPRISTPATPKKAEAVPDLATGTHAAGSSIFSASGAVGSSAPTRSYSTFVRRLFGDARRA